MLLFNLNRVVAIKGEKKSKAAILEAGVPYQTYLRMMKNKASFVTADILERLCLALKCTPNDLYQWIPSANAPENHPLEAMKYEGPDLHTKLASMSVAEIDALRKLMEGK